MIQFNLLPDVKIEYIKTKRTKRVVILLSSLVGCSAFAILVLLFLYVNVVQRTHINNLDEDIAQSSQELQDIPELDKILTVQNQLFSLTDLHEEKPAANRLFEYISKVTPVEATISKFDIDFNLQTASISGSTVAIDENSALSIVNEYVDSLKFSTYSIVSEEDDNEPELNNETAFSQVVLSQFSVTEEGANYQITFTYDPIIFDDRNDVTLTVPQTVTTRSQIQRPVDLFQPESEETQ
ncbi:MAG: hypothetical protein U5K77_01275 [Candidatus Saccharibacteria bacterium]|nr:hypothetical protein [Candidatus Saccharibacteria bacterium]